MAGAMGVDTSCHLLTRHDTSCHALSGLGGFFHEGLRRKFVLGDFLYFENFGEMSAIIVHGDVNIWRHGGRPAR